MIARFVRRLHDLRSCERGASLVELAIVLPFLALLVVGLIETGRYMAFAIRLSNAAHAGAAYGVLNPTLADDPTDIENAACSDSTFSCTTSTPKPGTTAAPDTMFVSTSLGCTYSSGPPDPNCASPAPGVQRNMFVTVSTSATFRPLLKYPYLPYSVPMSATAVMQAGE
jgi:Flp pilus assembly protein TadG